MGTDSFSFIHGADLHLDSPYKSLERPTAGETEMPDEVLRRLRNSSFEAFEHMIDLCISKQVDFLLLAGDIYDVADKSLRAQLRFRDGLMRLAEAKIAVFVVHGNHDHCAGWRAELPLPETVHVFSHREVEDRSVLRDGREIARVYGISYPQREVVDDYASRFVCTAKGCFTVALLHCNVGGSVGHADYAPCRLADLLRKGFDYWALGHVHRYMQLHRNNAEPWVLYPGCTQGRHWLETGEKGCLLVQVRDNHPVSLEFLPTASVDWITPEVSIGDLTNDLSLLDRIEGELWQYHRQSRGNPSMAKVLLQGRGVLHKHLNRPGYVENLTMELRNRLPSSGTNFLWLDSLRVITEPQIDYHKLSKTDTLLGDFLTLSKAVQANGKMRTELLRELSSLLEHPRAGRYLFFPDDDKLLEMLQSAEKMAVDLLWEGDD